MGCEETFRGCDCRKWLAREVNGYVDYFGVPRVGQISDTGTEIPRIMALPGKHMEQLRLAPSQMQPRGQMKKPLRDILRDISRRSKANVDMRGGPGGSIIFEGKGSVDAVRQALREVAQQVGSKVCGLDVRKTSI
jgi:hypothetical protein